MKWIYAKFVVAVILSMLTIQSYSGSVSQTVYGLINGQHFQSKTDGPFYIQLGSFSRKANAYDLEKIMRLKTKQPVTVRPKKGNYTVVIGPINSAAEVRSISRHAEVASTKSAPLLKKPTFIQQVFHQSVNRPVTKQQPHGQVVKNIRRPLDKDIMPTQGNWFIAGDVGVQNPNAITHHLTVDNGSEFPPPNNLDSYSTNSEASALLGVDGGYRWQRQTLWLPAYTLGFRYKHFFASNFGDQITQYSIPEFTNYNYSWNISSDILLLNAKLDLFRAGALMPYINGGIGVAFNQASGYSETALMGITPRISPAFSNKNKSSWAGSLGAGVDLQINPSFIVSVGYEFQYLGKPASGNGVDTWSDSALQFGSYQSNSAVLSVNYLFGN